MENVSLFASLPIRVMVNGDTLSPYFSTNGVALFQGVNPDTGDVVPSWSADSGPAITPHVGSAMGDIYTLASHVWKYNGTDLKFSVSGNSWVTSPVDPRFQLNPADGTIKIVGNLASKTNDDADMLEYNGKAVRGDVSYDIQKTIDIFISPLGSSSFGGAIGVDHTAIGTTSNGTITSAKINTCELYNSTGAVTSFTVKLYRGLSMALLGTYTNASIKNVEIGRDKVDGQEVFIAEFYIDGTDTAVYRTGFTITDLDDLYQLHLYDDGKGIDYNGGTSICKGYVYNVKTKAEYDAKKVSGNVKYALTKGGSDSVLNNISGTMTYAKLHDDGITLTLADISDKNGNPTSVSINVETMSLTLS